MLGRYSENIQNSTYLFVYLNLKYVLGSCESTNSRCEHKYFGDLNKPASMKSITAADSNI